MLWIVAGKSQGLLKGVDIPSRMRDKTHTSNCDVTMGRQETTCAALFDSTNIWASRMARPRKQGVERTPSGRISRKGTTAPQFYAVYIAAFPCGIVKVGRS